MISKDRAGSLAEASVRNDSRAPEASNVIHVLRVARHTNRWVVRVNDADDMTLESELRARDYARVLAVRLAARLHQSVIVRARGWHGEPRDEVVAPQQKVASTRTP